MNVFAPIHLFFYVIYERVHRQVQLELNFLVEVFGI